MRPIDTQDKRFHDGDGISELGTIVPAWWLNQNQDEILAVMTEAGVIPDAANNTQLLEAIKAIISDSTPKIDDATTSTKGVVKLSNAIDSSSETEAATPKAVKDAYDLANNSVSKDQIKQELGSGTSAVISQNHMTQLLSSFTSKPTNVTSQRPESVNHYNNTGAPMFVYVNMGKGIDVGATGPNLFLDDTRIIGSWISQNAISYAVMFIVPVGSYYKWIKNNGDISVILEYRA